MLDTAHPVGSGHGRKTLYQGMEQDDHNNPSVIFFRKRLYAFSAPHSGHIFPRDRKMFVRYRVSRGEYGRGGFSASRRIPIVPGCGLGYTYPNPVVADGRLYLFVRGPCWMPFFTSTTDGVHWKRWKTLVKGPSRMRPYAKYSSGPGGSVEMAFSDAHPSSYRTSLYHLRMRHGSFYRADGRRVGTMRSLPLRLSQLDKVAPYSRHAGRAWPEDIAVDGDRPVIVYSSTIGRRDVFNYARWSGTGWHRHRIARAGRGIHGYRNAGVSLNHAHPDWLVLVRTISGHNEVELRHTRDGGATFQSAALTHHSHITHLRPIIPRGWESLEDMAVLYISGRSNGYRSFQTALTMRVVKTTGRPLLNVTRRRAASRAGRPRSRCGSPRSGRAAARFRGPPGRCDPA